MVGGCKVPWVQIAFGAKAEQIRGFFVCGYFYWFPESFWVAWLNFSSNMVSSIIVHGSSDLLVYTVSFLFVCYCTAFLISKRPSLVEVVQKFEEVEDQIASRTWLIVDASTCHPFLIVQYWNGKTNNLDQNV